MKASVASAAASRSSCGGSVSTAPAAISTHADTARMKAIRVLLREWVASDRGLLPTVEFQPTAELAVSETKF